MNYTKGEWKAKRISGELGNMYYVNIPDYPHKIEAREEDSHLIAAAPDMYEALKEVQLMFDRGLTENMIGRKTMDRAIKALAKAEGRLNG